uniref:Protein kinase domain-containing protein n=1 Tax=Brassica oleracea var. oleracea TaxID=109376 RepID=A0A0D3E3N8_BRAOL
MSCFSCFSSKNLENEGSSMPAPYRQTGSPNNQRERTREVGANNAPSQSNNIEAQGFSFRELATATNNFRLENLIGEGGFGRVYKGKLDKTGQVVAVKQLDRNGLQGQKEFLVEVLMLSLLHHSNLVNLIGYCADGDQRLLAQPIFRDPTRFPQLADPLLRGEFPEKSLNQAVAVAAMCLNEEPMVRPLISDVVTALSFLGASSDFSNADSSHLQQNPSEIYHDAVQWDSSPR